jgi:hypothetical protein
LYDYGGLWYYDRDCHAPFGAIIARYVRDQIPDFLLLRLGQIQIYLDFRHLYDNQKLAPTPWPDLPAFMAYATLAFRQRIG